MASDSNHHTNGGDSAEAHAEAAITIRGLHKHFGAVHALRGVDLTVQRGEFFGLLGPNGAGKSTLINIIAGLTRSDSGSVAVMGYDVVSQYRESRRRLGVVPQELVYDSFFNVREVLRLQAGYFGFGSEIEPWIDELLDGLMLADKASANMRQLSGGMKRRVLVAQALVHKPQVVVLDEPTAGVDVELRQSLWGFVRRLHGEGHTIVLTTHYLEEAEQLCDRIAILDGGKVVALDTTAQLMDKGIGRIVRVFVTTAEPLPKSLELPDALRALVKWHDGVTLELQLDKRRDSIGDVLKLLTESGVDIVDLKTSEADLEDVFVELIQGRSK
ncbi:MAG: ABC transporter ATP-binding protein [Gammaproteobacteria bacterium]|nr:ABC transporter ATP-binding protein [Gammaproteobacteria bacterium]